MGARAASSWELQSGSEASTSATVWGSSWKMMFVCLRAVLWGDIPISGPCLEELQGREGSGPVGPVNESKERV